MYNTIRPNMNTVPSIYVQSNKNTNFSFPSYIKYICEYFVKRYNQSDNSCQCWVFLFYYSDTLLLLCFMPKLFHFSALYVKVI